MKNYKFISHTADIRMEIEGETLGDLFEAAVLGMNELLRPGFCADPKGNDEIVRDISIESSDATTLIIDFLSEVLTCAYEEKTVFCRVDFSKINETTVEAKIFGRKVQAFKEDIKAVTYHEAEVVKNEKGNWETTVVFDI